MAELHVIPDTRKATWRVQDGEGAVARPEYPSETEAEFAARAQAVARGVDRVVVHDRYARTRDLIRGRRGWLDRRR